MDVSESVVEGGLKNHQMFCEQHTGTAREGQGIGQTLQVVPSIGIKDQLFHTELSQESQGMISFNVMESHRIEVNYRCQNK